MARALLCCQGSFGSENLGTYKHHMVAYTESDNTLCGGGAWPHNTNCWGILSVKQILKQNVTSASFCSTGTLGNWYKQKGDFRYRV